MESDNDALVFIDGDCEVRDPEFLSRYEEYFANYGLVYGTRRHTDVTGLTNPPSDLLTANMDELWGHKGLDYTDLRVKSGAVGLFQKTDDFYEKLDLMITGMISWSCNFGMTKQSLNEFLPFLEERFGCKGLFDSEAFNDGWGYEDIAMGIDALYCGIKIWIDTHIEVIHNSHNRSDTLFSHIAGRHKIMNRVRYHESLKIKTQDDLPEVELIAVR